MTTNHRSGFLEKLPLRASYTDLLKASEVGVVGVEVWVAGVGDSGWPREGCEGDRVVSVALLVAACGWCDDDDDDEEEDDDDEEDDVGEAKGEMYWKG